MEHRYSARLPANINVLVYKSEIPVAFGRIVDGSKLGFFIETNFCDVNIDQLLDIELLPTSTEVSLCRYICNVQVIRKTEFGLGVEIEFTKTESNFNNSYSRAANF